MQFSLVGINVTGDASQMPRFLRLPAVILGKAVFFIVYLTACLALFGFLVNISHRILFG